MSIILLLGENFHKIVVPFLWAHAIHIDPTELSSERKPSLFRGGAKAANKRRVSFPIPSTGLVYLPTWKT